MSSQRGPKTSGTAGPAGPGGPRRPIPLPPESLRPPPRKVRNRRAAPPSASTSVGRARRVGASRGFWIGLSVPLVGFLAAMFYLGWGGPFPGSEQPTAGAGPEPEMQVRARLDRAPVGEESLMRGAAPVPATAPASAPETVPENIVAIQLASFRTRGKAERVLNEIQERTGLSGVILPATVDGIRWQRILLGSFSSPSEARAAAHPLLQDGTIRELVIRPVPPEGVPVLTGKDLK